MKLLLDTNILHLFDQEESFVNAQAF